MTIFGELIKKPLEDKFSLKFLFLSIIRKDIKKLLKLIQRRLFKSQHFFLREPHDSINLVIQLNHWTPTHERVPGPKRNYQLQLIHVLLLCYNLQERGAKETFTSVNSSASISLSSCRSPPIDDNLKSVACRAFTVIMASVSSIILCMPKLCAPFTP